MTKCDVISWIGSWNRKRTFREKKRKNLNKVFSLITVTTNVNLLLAVDMTAIQKLNIRESE